MHGAGAQAIGSDDPVGTGDAAGLDPGTTAHAWRALLDARIRLEGTVASMRQTLLATAVVIALATPLIDRFLILTQPEVLLVSLLPVLLLVAGGALDVTVYEGRLQELDGRIRHLEANHPAAAALKATRAEIRDPSVPGVGVIAFYLVPALALTILALWRLL